MQQWPGTCTKVLPWYSWLLARRGRRAHELVESLSRCCVGHEVDFARLILAEGHDRQAAVADRLVGDHPLRGRVIAQGPGAAGNVVSVDVRPLQLREALAAIDVAAGDRLANVVVVFPDRVDQILARPTAVSAERV